MLDVKKEAVKRKKSGHDKYILNRKPHCVDQIPNVPATSHDQCSIGILTVSKKENITTMYTSQRDVSDQLN